MSNLPKKLYELRKGRGLLQDELAEKLGVSRQAISKWEMGTGVPTLENLISISRFYDVSLDSLVKDEYETAISTDEANRCTRPIEYAPVYPEAKPITPTNTQPGVKPTVLQKAAINIITVFFIMVVSSTLSWLTSYLISLLQNKILFTAIEKMDLNSFKQFQTVEVAIFRWLTYAISIPFSLPQYIALYMILNRGKWIFSRPLFDSAKAESKHNALKKIMALLAIRITFDIATNLTMIALKPDPALYTCFTALIEYFLIYAVLTWRKPNIFKNRKALLLTVLITAVFTAAATVCNYYTLHVSVYTMEHLTDLRLYNAAGRIMMTAVISTFIVFHEICSFKTEEKNNPDA